MKKFVVFLITMLFIGSVYAKEYNYKTITYTVEIDGKPYAATVKYWDLYVSGVESEDSDYRFEMEYDTIVLTDSLGNNFTYDDTAGTNDHRIINIYGYCDFTNSSDKSNYICDDERSRTQFSLEDLKRRIGRAVRHSRGGRAGYPHQRMPLELSRSAQQLVGGHCRKEAKGCRQYPGRKKIQNGNNCKYAHNRRYKTDPHKIIILQIVCFCA